MRDLEQVKQALLVELRDEARFSLVNARLILKTGVNLAVVSPRQMGDPAIVAKVVEALKQMGFGLADNGQSKGKIK